jgi:hypothetical protein
MMTFVILLKTIIKEIGLNRKISEYAIDLGFQRVISTIMVGMLV